jgi:hypothetical protein
MIIIKLANSLLLLVYQFLFVVYLYLLGKSEVLFLAVFCDTSQYLEVNYP